MHFGSSSAAPAALLVADTDGHTYAVTLLKANLLT
ncbi:hypothetical protein SALBM311S_08629 [Streptomyces alboniger]